MTRARELPRDYPPAEHLLRDLGIWTETRGEPSRAGMTVTPEALDAGGAFALGPLAILIDVLAGGAALTAAAGGWIATSDLHVVRTGDVASGEVVATSRVLRAGQSTVVLEVAVEQGGRDVALATCSFARLSAEGDFQRGAVTPDADEVRHRFSPAGTVLPEPFEACCGFAWDGRGAVLEVRPYVGNSLGAIQGGVVAAFCTYAAERAVEPNGARPATECAIHYLALGRQGPMVARPRVLVRDRADAPVRVELVDTGAQDRLCAVANVRLA